MSRKHKTNTKVGSVIRAPGITKTAAAFGVVPGLAEPLPRGTLTEVAKAVGIHVRHVQEAVRLKRLLIRFPELRPVLGSAVRAGRLSLKAAVETVAEVKELQRNPPPKKRSQGGVVYQSAYAIPAEAARGTIETIRHKLGVGRSAMTDALALKRLLRGDRDLFTKWQGKALTGALSPRMILRHIAKAKAAAPARKRNTPRQTKTS